MIMKDYYQILHIKSASSAEDIKSAYRSLAKQHHPDHGGDPQLFHDIQEAYDTLSNPRTRRKYDDLKSSEPFGGQSYRMVDHPPLRTRADIFDDLVDLAYRSLGLNSEGQLELDIILSPTEAREGANLALSIPVEVICDHCFGFGGTIFNLCPVCRGNGIVYNRDTAYLTIEPGVDNGDAITFHSRAYKINGRFVIQQ